MTSAKNLPSHTKLKTRKPGQGAREEYTIDDLKRELAEAEREHLQAKRIVEDGGALSADSQARLDDAKARYIEMAQRLDAASDEDDDDEEGEEEEDENGSDEEESDDDDDDETAMLMRELEKIKRERAEEKAREEQEAMLMKGESGGSALLGHNPLLANRDFSVKRRWNDDVVFKNQAKGDDKPKKRFVNDMLRSDFHHKFMRKYIQ
ncbi:complexed with cef1p [Coemansia thaxteri]|nr:complexed with cef1p [Coemansia thaxteri]KAJ2465606.1 complexed with cef1p [Coemansia sp. RSA 2322]